MEEVSDDDDSCTVSSTDSSSSSNNSTSSGERMLDEQEEWLVIESIFDVVRHGVSPASSTATINKQRVVVRVTL
jgi:hypothetical protein